MDSLFNPEVQLKSTSSKISAAMERLSEVFRIFLWEENEKLSLSPLQMRILIFILFHNKHKATISYLSGEFNMKKATISDAVKTLEEKGLIKREPEESDKRVFYLILTGDGKKKAKKASLYAEMLNAKINEFDSESQEDLLHLLLDLIYKLQSAGVISTSRMCFSCSFFSNEGGKKYKCNLLKLPLTNKTLRFDCPEHEPAPEAVV